MFKYVIGNKDNIYNVFVLWYIINEYDGNTNVDINNTTKCICHVYHVIKGEARVMSPFYFENFHG